MAALLERAIEFAVKKHAGQVRKGTTIPYVTHVIEAMEIVSRMTEDEEIRVAAVLHDTLEDTETTREELVVAFGERVVQLVDAESEDKRKGESEEETWLDRKRETIKHLSKASTEIRMIALGDKLSNMRAMARDYKVKHEELWQRFNEKDPVMQGKYYCGLVNAFRLDKTIRKTPAFEEYADLCVEIFHVERGSNGRMIVGEL